MAGPISVRELVVKQLHRSQHFESLPVRVFGGMRGHDGGDDPLDS